MEQQPKPIHLFVSYSHADERWRKRLEIHLKPLVLGEQIKFWSDRQIVGGDLWKKEIRKAIARSDVVVLVISADFLASQFIRDHELPPILGKAKEEGTLILSIMASPCRIESYPELAEFQMANDPQMPLLCVSECEQERVFTRVAERVASEIDARREDRDKNIQRSENFLEPADWERLLKYGPWTFDKTIRSSGMGRFLLSDKDYGRRDFVIKTDLKFTNFEYPKRDIGIGMNAGIIFGWKTWYYNVLLTGNHVAVERVTPPMAGASQSGQHLTRLQPLKINPGETVRFEVRITTDRISILANGATVVEVGRPDQVEGRVGLRPWRSEMECSEFQVREVGDIST